MLRVVGEALVCSSDGALIRPETIGSTVKPLHSLILSAICVVLIVVLVYVAF